RVKLDLAQMAELEGSKGTSSPEELEPQRPNETWWHQFGGAIWIREIESRRPEQAHYAQQEAFLLGMFSALPKTRVLDFGCGFGRTLRNLRAIPGLEVYGCDISSKMLESAEEYIGDPEFVKERVRLVRPRAPLPYPDDFFDVSL